jgi:16S rRNA G966 N2-methylase RsmD
LFGLTCPGKAAELDGYRVQNGKREETATSGTSIFDPVLTELCYKWFIPTRGSILDPFAGGSVRGIVAATLGHDYVGVDLSARQIAANEVQAAEICGDIKPTWIVGDSREVASLLQTAGKNDQFDFVFACPPYFDLEVYSEDQRDLSVCSFDEFCKAYGQIILACAERLKPNRFAVFVIGDVRDKEGFYRKLPQLTVECFENAGMRLYNAAVLLTAVGSLPIRAGKQFSSGRKLGNTHQHVLCFFKGDPRKIKGEFPRLSEFGKDADDAEPETLVAVEVK